MKMKTRKRDSVFVVQTSKIKIQIHQIIFKFRINIKNKKITKIHLKIFLKF